MNSAMKDKLQGNWTQIKAELKKKFAQLKDDDLMYEKGKEEEFIGRLQYKLGKSKEEIRDFINNVR